MCASASRKNAGQGPARKGPALDQRHVFKILFFAEGGYVEAIRPPALLFIKHPVSSAATVNIYCSHGDITTRDL